VYNKPSSQDICFDVDISNDRPGNIILSDGRVLGRHKGISSYTVGQRKGLGIGYSEPLYVTRIDALNNIVTVGVRADIFKTGLIASGMNWIVEPKFPFNAAAKTRYGQENVACTVSDIGGGRVSVRFSKKMNAPTPGQCVVFYKRDTVLGGGWIDEAFDE
jgi:tRNA-specific 2-thiouridylase